jgi:hypothetical protein
MDVNETVIQLVNEYVRVNTEITNGIMNGKFNADEANKLLACNSKCFQGNIEKVLERKHDDEGRSPCTVPYFHGQPVNDITACSISRRLMENESAQE